VRAGAEQALGLGGQAAAQWVPQGWVRGGSAVGAPGAGWGAAAQQVPEGWGGRQRSSALGLGGGRQRSRCPRAGWGAAAQ
jgi:hypothetical protein